MPRLRAWAKAASQRRAASPCPRLLRGTYVCTMSITAAAAAGCAPPPPLPPPGRRWYWRKASPSGVSNLPASSLHTMPSVSGGGASTFRLTAPPSSAIGSPGDYASRGASARLGSLDLFFLSRKTKLPLNQRLQGDPQRPNWLQIRGLGS